jgi:hypothetical protein
MSRESELAQENARLRQQLANLRGTRPGGGTPMSSEAYHGQARIQVVLQSPEQNASNAVQLAKRDLLQRGDYW